MHQLNHEAHLCTLYIIGYKQCLNRLKDLHSNGHPEKTFLCLLDSVYGTAQFKCNHCLLAELTTLTVVSFHFCHALHMAVYQCCLNFLLHKNANSFLQFLTFQQSIYKISVSLKEVFP